MRPEDFGPSATGQLTPISFTEFDPATRRPTAVRAFAFLPHPLPDTVTLDPVVYTKLQAAAYAVGRLTGFDHLATTAHTSYNPYLLIRQFIRREAVASSRIEGTVTDLRDLAAYEDSVDTSADPDDFQEVLNYVQALEYGLEVLPDRDVTAAFIRELHAMLMAGVRGQDKRPGNYRESQVYIGQHGTSVAGARFIPPPAFEVPALMYDLERAIAQPAPIPELILIALVHYQFETIHPFEDGNGRMGRLIISLLLQRWGILSRPLLYLSDYFERHRQEYLDSLLAVSQQGTWSQWVLMFLEAVRVQADDATARGTALLALRDRYLERYRDRGPKRAPAFIDQLFKVPSMEIRQLSATLGIHYSSAQSLILQFEKDDILREVTGRQRDRRYTAHEILDILAAPVREP